MGFSVAGISRSVTIAGAYIMSVTNINHQEAFQAIRSARNAANPNIGFQRQLYEFEISGACDKVISKFHVSSHSFFMFKNVELRNKYFNWIIQLKYFYNWKYKWKIWTVDLLTSIYEFYSCLNMVLAYFLRFFFVLHSIFLSSTSTFIPLFY